MPWKECKPMDERLRFIARLLEGEKMAPLCREFGISRVTGYKIFNRWWPSAVSTVVSAPVVVPGAWLRVRRCWSMMFCPFSLFASGC